MTNTDDDGNDQVVATQDEERGLSERGIIHQLLLSEQGMRSS